MGKFWCKMVASVAAENRSLPGRCVYNIGSSCSRRWACTEYQHMPPWCAISKQHHLVIVAVQGYYRGKLCAVHRWAWSQHEQGQSVLTFKRCRGRLAQKTAGAAEIRYCTNFFNRVIGGTFNSNGKNEHAYKHTRVRRKTTQDNVNGFVCRHPEAQSSW